MSAPSALSLIQSAFPGAMRLGTSDIAKVVGWHPQSVRNAAHDGVFPIKTYLDCGKRYADIRDIADHLEKQRNASGKTLGRPTKASKLAHK